MQHLPQQTHRTPARRQEGRRAAPHTAEPRRAGPRAAAAPHPAPAAAQRRGPLCRGIISDWGGVLTAPLGASIDAWLAADGIDADHYGTVIGSWFAGEGPLARGGNAVHALERGEVDVAEFESALAAGLRLADGGPVPADGLIDRMFAGFTPVEPMYDALEAARRHGVRTTLLSNSWGNGYPRERFARAFDSVVISGEVGLRKPEPEIYLRALEETGLAPEECLFIDDLEHNVAAAAALGMVGVLHTDAAATRSRIAAECGVPLERVPAG